jgi:hypothetical protein
VVECPQNVEVGIDAVALRFGIGSRGPDLVVSLRLHKRPPLAHGQREGIVGVPGTRRPRCGNGKRFCGLGACLIKSRDEPLSTLALHSKRVCHWWRCRRAVLPTSTGTRAEGETGH